jgi:hypothetical protein
MCAKQAPHIQGGDAPEVLALEAARGVFEEYKPPQQSAAQRLVRELALDGGLRPRGSGQHTTLRFKYAFDGCKCDAPPRQPLS